jgi:hypothetical protein
LIVIDQFERLFIQQTSNPGIETEDLKVFLCLADANKLKEHHRIIVIFLRRDYYFDLCLLFSSQSLSHKLNSLVGLSTDARDPGLNGIKESFWRVVHDELSVKQII